MGSSQVRRVLALAFFLLLAAAVVGPDLRRVFGHPLGLSGVTFDYSATVVGVNEAARRAGVREGDRADLARAGIDQRQSIVMGYAREAGLHYDVPLLRGTQHLTVPIVTTPENRDRLAMVWLRFIVQILVTLMAALLVVRRPNVATWGLFAAMFVGCSPINDTYMLGPLPWRVFAWNLFWVVNASVAFGALFFAIHLLHPGPLPAWRRRLETIAIILSGAAFANAVLLANFTLFGNTPHVSNWIGYAISGPLPYYLAPAVMVATYFESMPQVRQRLRWIIGGFLFAAICNTADTLGSQGNLGVYQTTYVQHSLLVVAQYAGIMLPVSYAILKHHIMDVNVAISRATVYTALSILVVGSFALVDMVFSRVLTENRAGLIADVVLALILGFTFNTVHHHVDDFVDRLLFRKKHQAEAYVAGLAPAMAFARTPAHVCSLLLDEPRTAFHLSGASLLDCRDGCPERLDVFASYLEGRHGSIRLAATAWNITEFLDGMWTPAIAIPLYSHSTVTGIAVYGLHTDLTDIDAEEALLLERVVEAAGSAFDRLEADAMRVEIAELRSQLVPAVKG